MLISGVGGGAGNDKSLSQADEANPVLQVAQQGEPNPPPFLPGAVVRRRGGSPKHPRYELVSSVRFYPSGEWAFMSAIGEESPCSEYEAINTSRFHHSTSLGLSQMSDELRDAKVADLRRKLKEYEEKCDQLTNLSTVLQRKLDERGMDSTPDSTPSEFTGV